MRDSRITNRQRKVLEKWKPKAIEQIRKWLTDESFQDEIIKNVMKNEYMGPFTKFLYHFAFENQDAGWGIMIDFNERSQQIHLCNHYYDWMHELRDGIDLQLTQKDNA